MGCSCFSCCKPSADSDKRSAAGTSPPKSGHHAGASPNGSEQQFDRSGSVKEIDDIILSYETALEWRNRSDSLRIGQVPPLPQEIIRAKNLKALGREKEGDAFFDTREDFTSDEEDLESHHSVKLDGEPAGSSASAPGASSPPRSRAFSESRGLYYPYDVTKPPFQQPAYKQAIKRFVDEVRQQTMERLDSEDVVSACVLGKAGAEGGGGGKRSLEGADEAGGFMSVAKRVVARMKPGQELTHFELPAQFCTEYTTVMCSGDLISLLEASDRDFGALKGPEVGEEAQMLGVVQFLLDVHALRAFDSLPAAPTAMFPVKPMKKPCNSVLGETHGVRCGHTRFKAEQISHHPPTTASHVYKEDIGLHFAMTLTPKPYFEGTGVRVFLNASREIRLEGTGREYQVSHSPDVCLRWFGINGYYFEDVGEMVIRNSRKREGDSEGELVAKLRLLPCGYMGKRTSLNRVEGEIIRIPPCSSEASDKSKKKTSSPFNLRKKKEEEEGEVLYRVEGRYHREVEFTPVDSSSGRSAFTWRVPGPKEGEPPVVHLAPLDPATESNVVWSKLFAAVSEERWKVAGAEKRRIEVAQRLFMAHLKQAQKTWQPRYFHQTTASDFLRYRYSGDWDADSEQVPDDPEWQHYMAKAIYAQAPTKPAQNGTNK